MPLLPRDFMTEMQHHPHGPPAVKQFSSAEHAGMFGSNHFAEDELWYDEADPSTWRSIMASPVPETMGYPAAPSTSPFSRMWECTSSTSPVPDEQVALP